MDTYAALIRRVIAAAGIVLMAMSARGQPADPRIDRVEAWLHAVLEHEPGTSDDYAARVGSWTPTEIQLLWLDTTALTQLMRNPRRGDFNIRSNGRSTSQPLRYTPVQLRRMRVLACAAAGIALTDSRCTELTAARDLDPALRRLSERVAADRMHDEDNFILRRGALLHADIAMFIPAAVEPIKPIAPLGPQRVRMQTSDGLQVDLTQVATHWEIARMLLDAVKSRGRDDMVRLWYRATAAWMQSREDHDTDHLDRARAMFPDDADILFLSGCQHETYASPGIQGPMRTAVIPTGVRIDVGSDRAELKQAEAFFRRTLAANPSMAEAHLRLGRVLSLLERPADAVPELREAIASTEEDLLRYYGQLFLGAAEEMLSHFDAARDAYAAAAMLSPDAQSPRLALSALARRRGNRADALRELTQILEPPAEEQADDPWWTYHIAQARNVDELLEQLRQPFRADGGR
jgi:tetratricopeptide (TPR) repeat protein